MLDLEFLCNQSPEGHRSSMIEHGIEDERYPGKMIPVFSEFNLSVLRIPIEGSTASPL